MKALLAVAAIAALAAVATGVGEGAHARARGSCGAAARLRGAPILTLGPLRVAGFTSDHCAEILLDCGPKSGGYQAPLSIEVSNRLTKPIVLKSTATVKFVLVGTTTPAPRVPRCVPSSRARPTATLHAPDMYWVLFVFAPRNASFHLTAWRGGRPLGSGVISALGS